MTRQRVYIATTLADLAEAADRGYLSESEERFVAPGDDEESEYDALLAAADASAALSDPPGRRVVAVADVTDPDGPVAMELVDAVHVDLDDPDEPDADLAWFAHQEIPHLVELLQSD
jgi:hypothetical protein